MTPLSVLDLLIQAFVHVIRVLNLLYTCLSAHVCLLASGCCMIDFSVNLGVHSFAENTARYSLVIIILIDYFEISRFLSTVLKTFFGSELILQKSIKLASLNLRFVERFETFLSFTIVSIVSCLIKGLSHRRSIVSIIIKSGQSFQRESLRVSWLPNSTD